MNVPPIYTQTTKAKAILSDGDKLLSLAKNADAVLFTESKHPIDKGLKHRKYALLVVLILVTIQRLLSPF